MLKNPRRAGKGPAAWFGDSMREVVAAWLVLLLIVAAGLSMLGAHRFGVADCTPMLAMPGARHHLALEQEWGEPACAIGPCGKGPSARQIDVDRAQAVEANKDEVPIYYGSSSQPVSLHTNGGSQDVPLC